MVDSLWNRVERGQRVKMKIKKVQKGEIFPQKIACNFAFSVIICILLSYDFQKEVTS